MMYFISNFICNQWMRLIYHNEWHFDISLQPELITKHGYIAETHYVWTEDGYRLELHRVVKKPQMTNSETTPMENCNDKISELLNTENGSKLSEALGLEIKEEDSNIPKVKPPVLINHGLLSSSADWVLLGPHRALG